jgi:hypothetical protein
MTHHESAVSRFLNTYAQNSRDDNMSVVLSQFADPFLSADPKGTHCVRVSDFAAVLPKRKLLFDRLGCKPAELLDIDETQLDARYVLAKTTWRFDFARADSEKNEQVLTHSTFLIDTGADECKIVMYMSHQDIMQVLRDRGILRD